MTARNTGTEMLIERTCEACGGYGWRADLPAYVEDLTCPDCNGNKRVWIDIRDTTDEELKAALQDRWQAVEEFEQRAREQAREAFLIDEELTRREATS